MNVEWSWNYKCRMKKNKVAVPSLKFQVSFFCHNQFIPKQSSSWVFRICSPFVSAQGDCCHAEFFVGVYLELAELPTKKVLIINATKAKIIPHSLHLSGYRRKRVWDDLKHSISI